MRHIQLEAPAKLNFGLRVVGVRDDGFHLLESLFVPLDLHDDVQLVLAEGKGDERQVELELLPAEGETSVPTDVPRDRRNLASKAAHAFLEAAGLTARIHITLRKRIPSAAGLGGGSSDAGAVLRGLASAWPGRVEPQALERVALQLGADVPFFLDPGPALVEGIGERRTPRSDWPAVALVLANPGQPVSTADVFAGWDAVDEPTPPGQLSDDLDRLAKVSVRNRAAAGDAWQALLRNDLGRAAEGICPAMENLRARLSAVGAVATGQSGSGATVFGVYADRRQAQVACEMLSANDSGWFRVAISLGAR